MNPKRKPIPKAVEHQVREQCGQACANPACRKWNTATHELHHIDGDRSQSIVGNLILLCANCHSEEQQGTISAEKIMIWKQMAESGYLPPVTGQIIPESTVLRDNHGIIADRFHINNLTVNQKNDSGAGTVGTDEVKADRIRMAKAKIRDWIDDVEDAHPAYLYQTHESISGTLKSMKNLLADDLLPENRERFTNACLGFLKITSDEITPVVTPSPMTGSRSKEDQDREMENWHKPGKLLVGRLTEILNCI